jgi:hypothetical protein
MTSSPHRRFFVAAMAACAALLSACAPSARTGGPAPSQAHLWTPQSTSAEISRSVRRECGRPSDTKRACVKRNLLALIDQAGLGRAMEVLDALSRVDGVVRQNAHELAHDVGVAAYRTPGTVAATFAACPAVQGGGCIHGVVQGYFLALMRQGRLPGTPELDALCEPHRAATFLFFQCAHGMGHGLMAVYANHVPMSLDGCDQATEAFIRESCYGGVFMENIVLVTHPHHTTEGHAEANGDAHGEHPAGHDAHGGDAGMAHGSWNALDADDPLYPCNAVGPAYWQACYTMQTSAIMLFNHGDVVATARACERAPETMVATCFGSLGRDVMALAGQGHRRALQLCARAAGMGGGRGDLWCTLGVVQNLVNLAADPGVGMRFCRLVATDDHKRACYGAVGEVIYSLDSTIAARGESCLAAEPAFVADCRRGAALDPPVRQGTQEGA